MTRSKPATSTTRKDNRKEKQENELEMLRSQAQARVKVRKAIPIKVQLAVASDSGSVDRVALLDLREKQKYFQKRVTREANQLQREMDSEHKTKLVKETDDLLNVFKLIGMHQYVNNFPNQPTLKLALTKSKRAKTKEGQALMHEHNYSKLGEELHAQDRKIGRASFAMANLHAYKNPIYIVRKKGKGTKVFKKKLDVAQLQQRMAKGQEAKMNALKKRQIYLKKFIDPPSEDSDEVPDLV